MANMNFAQENYPQFKNAIIDELISNLDDIPKEIRTAVWNHGGVHYGHSLYWSIMSLVGILAVTSQRGMRHFGCFEQMKDKLEDQHPESGYAVYR